MRYDLLVVGGGPGGYVAAIRAAQNGLRVACVEMEKNLGGVCLNVGCIPSKALLFDSEQYAFLAERGGEHGIECSELRPNLARMMERKGRLVEGVAKGVDSLFRKHKVVHIRGRATLLSPQSVRVGDEMVEAEAILLATGSRPIPLPFLPFDEERVLSSTGALSLKEVPKRLLLVGAGVIGLELGSVYRRLGAEVEVVELLDHICPALDRTMSTALQKALEGQGMRFHLSHKVVAGSVTSDGVAIQVEGPSGEQREMRGDRLLVAIGRRPNSSDLGLEAVGVAVDRGFVRIDGDFRTTVSTIYAIGDLVEGPMLAHKASQEGVAVADLLAGKGGRLDYIEIPNVVYTAPEVASVGFSEEELARLGVAVAVGSFPFRANSRAHATGEHEGLVKVVAEKGSGRLLGVHICGPHASEMVGEAVVALRNRMSARELGGLCHAHPTYSEAIKEAAMAVDREQIHL